MMDRDQVSKTLIGQPERRYVSLRGSVERNKRSYTMMKRPPNKAVFSYPQQIDFYVNNDIMMSECTLRGEIER
jgi:hypothetical protein